jgi:hypothetical protein
MKAIGALLSVSGTACPDGTKYRLKVPLMKLYLRSLHTVGTADGLFTPAGAAAVQMLLEQDAHQLTPSFFKLSFQFAMVHRTAINGIKKIYDLFEASPPMAIGPFKGRHCKRCAHRPLPPIPEPACGIFYQWVDQDGFYPGTVTLVGFVHAPAPAGLSQFYPVACPITAPVKPLPLHKGLHKQRLDPVLTMPVGSQSMQGMGKHRAGQIPDLRQHQKSTVVDNLLQAALRLSSSQPIH